MIIFANIRKLIKPGSRALFDKKNKSLRMENKFIVSVDGSQYTVIATARPEQDTFMRMIFEVEAAGGKKFSFVFDYKTEDEKLADMRKLPGNDEEKMTRFLIAKQVLLNMGILTP